MNVQLPIWKVVLLGVAAWLAFGGAKGCTLPNWPVIGGKATAAVYTYEKDQHTLPSDISAALNSLNRRTPPILATHDEIDTTNGPGETPEQYKTSRPAAKAIGLPALVVMANGKVIKAIKDPKAADVEGVK